MSLSKSKRGNKMVLLRSLPSTSPSREEKRLARKFPDKNDINYSQLISSYLAGEVSKVGKFINSSSDSSIAPTKYPYIPWNCKKEANYWRYLENIFKTGTSGGEEVAKRRTLKKGNTLNSRRPPAKRTTNRKAVKYIESEKTDYSSQGSERSIPVRPNTGITCDYISPALEWLISSSICASEAKKSKLLYQPDDELYPYYSNNEEDDFQGAFIHDEAIHVKEITELSGSSSRSDFNESLETESDSGQNLDISFTQTNISVIYNSGERKNLHKRQGIKGDILSQALTKLARVQNLTNSTASRSQDYASPKENSSPSHSSLSSEREKKQQTKQQKEKGKSIKQQNSLFVGTPLSDEREATNRGNPIKERGTPRVRTPLSGERKATNRGNPVKEQGTPRVRTPLSGEREATNRGNPIKEQGTPRVRTPLSGERKATNRDNPIKEQGTPRVRTPLSGERKATNRDNPIKEQGTPRVRTPLSGEREATNRGNPIKDLEPPRARTPLSDEWETTNRGNPIKEQGTPRVRTPLSGEWEATNRGNLIKDLQPLRARTPLSGEGETTNRGNPIKDLQPLQARTPLSGEREKNPATERSNRIKQQSNTLVHSPPLIDKEGNPSRMQHAAIKEQNSALDLSSVSSESKLDSSEEEDTAIATEQLRIQNALKNRKYRVKRGLDAIPLMKRADIPGYLDVAVQKWLKERQKKHKEFQRRKNQTETKEYDEDGVHEARCERALEETIYALGRSLEQVKVVNRPDRIATLKRYFGLPQKSISPQVHKWRCNVIPRRRRPPSRCRSLPSEASIVPVVQKKRAPKPQDDAPNRSSSTSNLSIPKQSSECELPKRCKTAPPQCNYVPQLFLKQPTWSHRYNFTKYERASSQLSIART